jgi:hypothetical protein
MNQAAVKYGDQAPMAAVCCNVCRTCVQTNILRLASARSSAVRSRSCGFVRRPTTP